MKKNKKLIKKINFKLHLMIKYKIFILNKLINSKNLFILF